MRDQSADAARHHIDEDAHRRSAVVAGEARETHVYSACAAPLEPGARGLKINLIYGSGEIATRTESDHTQYGLRGDRCGAVEEAAHDLIERAVAAHGNDHFEAITEGGSREGRSLPWGLRDHMFERAQGRPQQLGNPVPAPAGGAGCRGRIHDHQTAIGIPAPVIPGHVYISQNRFFKVSGNLAPLLF